MLVLALLVAQPVKAPGAPDADGLLPEGDDLVPRSVAVLDPPSEAARRAFADAVAIVGDRVDLELVGPGDADLVVHWVPMLLEGDRLGQYVPDAGRIEVALGDRRCGAWIPYDQATLTRAIAHELGHGVGFAHVEGSLMAERLPADYAGRCERAGAVTLSPWREHIVHLDLPVPARAEAHVRGPVQACLGHDVAVQCGTSVPDAEGGLRLRMRCPSLGPCEVAYRITVLPRSDGA